MNDMKIRGTYMGQSGFFLEFQSATLIFDWVEGELPTVRTDKPLYVFISHIHADHFKQDIFSLIQKYPKTEFFLGYNRQMPEINAMLDKLPEATKNALSCFDGIQKLYSDDGKVMIKTLKSTDLGVAFLVEIEGKRIFHAGDLFLMQTQTRDMYVALSSTALMSGHVMPSYTEYLKEAEQEFIQFTEPLRGMHIDYGMLPLDPRFPNIGYATVKRYLEIATFDTWSPMHLWGKYEFVDKFLDDYPEYASKMIAISRNQNVRKQIKLGESFLLPEEEKNKLTAEEIGFEVASEVAVESIGKFGKSVIAKPGDVLVFRLKYKNIGHAVQKSVIGYDNLPNGIEYITGSTTYKTPYANNPVSDRLFNGGMNLGDYRKGDWMILTYKARILANGGAYKAEDTHLHNDASIATANGTGYSKVEIVVRR